MPECRSCKRPIVWRKTQNQKAIPIDPDPVEAGNIMIHDADTCTVLSADERAGILRNDPHTKLHVSHFATCPNSKKHWKEKT